MEEFADKRNAKRTPEQIALWASFAPPPRPNLGSTKERLKPLANATTPTIVTLKNNSTDPDRPYQKLPITWVKKLEKALANREKTSLDALSNFRSELALMEEEMSDPKNRQDRLNDGNIIDDKYNSTLDNIEDLELRISLIPKAKARLQEGKYARCEFCFMDIPLERMMVLPEYPACAECWKHNYL